MMGRAFMLFSSASKDLPGRPFGQSLCDLLISRFVVVNATPGAALADVNHRDLARVGGGLTVVGAGDHLVVGEDGCVSVSLHTRVVHRVVNDLPVLRQLLELRQDVR